MNTRCGLIPQYDLTRRLLVKCLAQMIRPDYEKAKAADRGEFDDQVRTAARISVKEGVNTRIHSQDGPNPQHRGEGRADDGRWPRPRQIADPPESIPRV